MRQLLHVVMVLVGVAFVIVLLQSSVRADDSSDCSGQCLLRTQYMTPDQRYQERQREYREQQNREYYERDRNQRDLQQQLERRRSDSYGAIAYSSSARDYGYSFGYATQAQAESRAKQECGKNDCEIAVWFSNACGALAIGDDDTWTGEYHTNEQRARALAQASCVKEGGKNCKVIASRCSR